MFLLGVAYSDTDANHFYSLGEGVGGMTVSIGASSTATAASGGYTLGVGAGTHTITATGGTASNYNITTANGTLTVGKAALTATSLSIPIFDGELGLGTWQGIYVWEHRRHASSRRLLVHVTP